jgi:hypothetical protein
MSWTIPRYTPTSLKKGNAGIAVWSLQKALTEAAFTLQVVADGDFGPATEASVKKFQLGNGLLGDGVAGPRTQRALVIAACARADDEIPAGLLDGFAAGEGGYYLAPVNWSVAGGVDCGAFQRRVYDEDYDNAAVIQRAFDTGYQARLLAGSLSNLRGIFISRLGTKDGYNGMRPAEKAWRLAALNHNYPSGADRLSRTPIHQLSSYWTTAQPWVYNFGFKFPDGTPIRTPLQWCHSYAGVLGAGRYGTTGSVTRACSTWP